MHLDGSQLAAGRLGALFREGAIGVVIKGDPRIQKAWEMLLPRMKAANAGEERLPWEAPVVDMARNLYSDGGLNCTGDVKIGRASGRDRGCQSVEISVVAGA